MAGEEREDLKEADRLEQAAGCLEQERQKADWLMEGERLTISEALAAKPGYRRRLESAAEFLLCSRQRETERKEAEERQRQAELDAAQEKQRAAQEREKAAQEKTGCSGSFRRCKPSQDSHSHCGLWICHAFSGDGSSNRLVGERAAKGCARGRAYRYRGKPCQGTS